MKSRTKGTTCRGFRKTIAAILLGVVIFLLGPTFLSGHDFRQLRIPLTFEENLGQADSSAHFIAPLGNGTVSLTDDGFILSASRDHSGPAVRLCMLNSNSSAPIAESPTVGFANYYTYADSKSWLSRV